MFAVLAFLAFSSAPAYAAPRPAPPRTAHAEVTLLRFADMLDASAAQLQFSQRLLALNGKRVRIVGYMADMETPPADAFYLCPRAVFCDESGGGTGDLPPEAVRVQVSATHGRQVAHLPGPLVATGVLEVGPRTETDGTTSRIRLRLDGPARRTAAPTVRHAPAKRAAATKRDR